ncbi:fumarylacetoacetate hydrolase family protein [Embleya sp. MST-111070]|uniref:fumarylacetoacetate hydrolase family protein n=1 Tax=Embleya sp. MST-111070 TaxID=3398231 RepID=UPI003F739E1A
MTQDAVTASTGRRPGKVLAVHLNYPSRARQRGRVPDHASYFLKPGSSLTGSGRVERPAGVELLGFEGEIALVVGRAAHRVTPAEAWGHIGWVTAANDLGLYDLRHADKGANVRSKGGDGFTPLGPILLPAAELRPEALRVRTWLDGELVQEDTTATLLFDFAHLIADLSRLLTLEVGDVILTGTPAGAGVAEIGQRIEVEVDSLDDPTRCTGPLRTDVVAGPALAGWGTPPLVDPATRADAHGAVPDPALTDDLRTRLGRVAVATLSVQLRARGFDTVSIDGVRPLTPGTRLVGTARTLRYIPFRKDLFAAHGNGHTAQKRAVDNLEPGQVLVMEARGVDTAGTLGDILALRARTLGAAGIVTDGAVRDSAAVAALGLPVLAAAAHPAVLGRRHVPWDVDVTVSCGGATVQVGDVVVADDDGAVVIPPALVTEVLAAAEEQEARERFITEQVARGAALAGLYPIGPEWEPAYRAWRAALPPTHDSASPITREESR